MVKKLWRYVKPFQYNIRTWWTNGRTRFLYHYHTSAYWRAIKIVKGRLQKRYQNSYKCKKIHYEESLQRLKIPTLKYRRLEIWSNCIGLIGLRYLRESMIITTADVYRKGSSTNTIKGDPKARNSGVIQLLPVPWFVSSSMAHNVRSHFTGFMIQEIIDLHYNIHTFFMICVNLIFQIGLS